MWLTYLVGLGVGLEHTAYPALETSIGVRQQSGADLCLRARLSETRANAGDNEGNTAWLSTASLKTLDLGIGLGGATGSWLVDAWLGVHVVWGSRHDFEYTETEPIQPLVDRTVHVGPSVHSLIGVLVGHDVSTVFGQRLAVFLDGELASGDRNDGMKFVVDPSYAAATVGIAVRR